MSDAPETLSTILAEMRAVAADHSDATSITEWASRIEAAAGRERAECRSRLSDANEVAENFRRTLKTALDHLAYATQSPSASTPAKRESAPPTSDSRERPAPFSANAAAMREALLEARRDFDGLRRNWRITDAECECYESKCAVALSAPARNCDRFADWEAATAAFAETPTARNPPGFNYWRGFAEWAFAPAEGGDHA